MHEQIPSTHLTSHNSHTGQELGNYVITRPGELLRDRSHPADLRTALTLLEAPGAGPLAAQMRARL